MDSDRCPAIQLGRCQAWPLAQKEGRRLACRARRPARRDWAEGQKSVSEKGVRAHAGKAAVTGRVTDHDLGNAAVPGDAVDLGADEHRSDGTKCLEAGHTDSEWANAILE